MKNSETKFYFLLEKLKPFDLNSETHQSKKLLLKLKIKLKLNRQAVEAQKLLLVDGESYEKFIC